MVRRHAGACSEGDGHCQGAGRSVTHRVFETTSNCSVLPLWATSTSIRPGEASMLQGWVGPGGRGAAGGRDSGAARHAAVCCTVWVNKRAWPSQGCCSYKRMGVQASTAPLLKLDMAAKGARRRFGGRGWQAASDTSASSLRLSNLLPLLLPPQVASQSSHQPAQPHCSAVRSKHGG